MGYINLNSLIGIEILKFTVQAEQIFWLMCVMFFSTFFLKLSAHRRVVFLLLAFFLLSLNHFALLIFAHFAWLLVLVLQVN